MKKVFFKINSSNPKTVMELVCLNFTGLSIDETKKTIKKQKTTVKSLNQKKK